MMGSLVTFPRHVAESPELRKAASDAAKALDESSVEMSMRKDIFDKLVDYKENYCAGDNLSPEYARCLDKLIHNGRRNGTK
jgi:Zn-dependent oligopeptidase